MIPRGISGFGPLASPFCCSRSACDSNTDGPSHLLRRRLWDTLTLLLGPQLGKLLEDLGVEVTEERIREAFSELEHRGWDGETRLSLEELEAWWASDTVT